MTSCPDPAEYLRGLLGRPWHAGRFNCWHCARKILRDLAGVPLPRADLAALAAVIRAGRGYETLFRADHPARAEWRRLDRPEHLSLVLAAPVAGEAHAGVWLAIDAGVVAHCDPLAGVVVENEQAFAARFRAIGWYRPA